MADKNAREVTTLAKYDPKEYNVLLPTTTIQQQRISPLHKPIVEIVELDPDPDGPDVYKQDGKGEKLSLRKTALMKFAIAAGLVWDWRNTRRVDDGKDPNIVRYSAVAALRKDDSTWIPLKADKEIDLAAIEADLRENVYPKKAKNLKKAGKLDQSEENYVKYNVERDMRLKRLHKCQLAETGAMLRVIRSLLALPPTFTPAQIRKPFVLMRVVFDPDMKDPDMRKLLLDEARQSARAAYKGPEEQATITAGSTEEVTEGKAAEQPVIDVGGDEEVESGDKIPWPSVDEFAGMVPLEQSNVLEELMTEANYDRKGLKNAVIPDWATEHRIKFFKKLMDDLPKPEGLPFED